MDLNRRWFLKTMGAASIAGSAAVEASAETAPDGFGVLVDIPNCIGCRKCEFACEEAAGFRPAPIETFDDKSVFNVRRPLSPRQLTVINQHPGPGESAKPIYVKSNCLHCNEPACASACLVGALSKNDNGAVTYDAWKCMGCRYCMIACPFQIPNYEYDNALTPQVRKCSFCFERIAKEGGLPACVKICPRECLTFGRRAELLQIAHRRIAEHRGEYVDHVYGETEAGGTAWLYLSAVPFEKLGFMSLGPTPPSRLTESIQHGVFKGFVPPLALYGILALIQWSSRRGEPTPDVPSPLRSEDAHAEGMDGNGRPTDWGIRPVVLGETPELARSAP